VGVLYDEPRDEPWLPDGSGGAGGSGG
jgi:hypothetical protein